ncbi:lipopolysaccharide biosynthesis protein [Aeoliella sp. ICT_H6.2]|uniref:Lipopolysaccharide biosynthesis protein n=1 Tax=Aeoliella straminimaris TaxID=2954799 RepID=A0A9X2FJL6_9BACT|nr:lipopolysaccharide biosynthesis protein [Aeoliella straminimaris]MCO6047431.1 lipopolysaccharide biosynthesis protein [Aeoliella straminimaris]
MTSCPGVHDYSPFAPPSYSVLRLKTLAQNLRRSATSGGFLAKAARLASGHATGYAVTLAISPLLARLYGPEAFGLYALFVLAISSLGPVATLRFDQTIPLAAGRRASGVLATLALVAAVSVTVAGVVLGELATAMLHHGRSASSWVLLVPLVADGVLCFTMYQIVAGLLLGEARYRELARMRVTYALVAAGTHLTIPLVIGPTLLGLPAGQAVGFAAAAIYGSVQLKRLGSVRLPLAVRTLVRYAQRYRQFAVFGVPAAVVSNLGIHAPALLLTAMYNLEAAGVYALAQRVFTSPLTLVTNSFSRTFLAEARAGRLPELFRSAAKGAILLTAPPIAVVAIVAPWLFSLVFGAEWTAAGWVCTLLSPMAISLVLAQVVSPTFDIAGMQALRLKRETQCTALVGMGIGAAYVAGLPYLAAIAGASVGATLGYALLVTSAANYARQSASSQGISVAPAPLGEAA